MKLNREQFLAAAMLLSATAPGLVGLGCKKSSGTEAAPEWTTTTAPTAEAGPQAEVTPPAPPAATITPPHMELGPVPAPHAELGPQPNPPIAPNGEAWVPVNVNGQPQAPHQPVSLQPVVRNTGRPAVQIQRVPGR
jgi:hypothetical protein